MPPHNIYHNDKYIGEYAGKYIVYEEHHVKKNYYEQSAEFLFIQSR